MKNLLNLVGLITLLIGINVAQGQTQNWAGMGLYSNGSIQAYNSKSLTKIGWPPQTVTIQTHILDTAGNFQQEVLKNYDCNKRLVQINNQPAALSSDPQEIEMLHGLCGINQKDGYWFLVGATKAQSGYMRWYADASSIKKVNTPIAEGTSIRVMNGGKFDVSNQPLLKFNEANVGEIVLNCNEKNNFYLKGNNLNTNFETHNLRINSVPMALHDLVCGGYFITNKSAIGMAKKSEDKPIIDMAKEKCAELGFKQGSEKFGKCVLQLTK
jgi:hypothetical protein